MSRTRSSAKAAGTSFENLINALPDMLDLLDDLTGGAA